MVPCSDTTCAHNEDLAGIPVAIDSALAARRTYVFASVVVAQTMAGEVKDIFLCSCSIDLTAEEEAAKPKSHTIMRLLLAMRAYTFLPALQFTVMVLVIVKGGDALTVW